MRRKIRAQTALDVISETWRRVFKARQTEENLTALFCGCWEFDLWGEDALILMLGVQLLPSTALGNDISKPVHWNRRAADSAASLHLTLWHHRSAVDANMSHRENPASSRNGFRCWCKYDVVTSGGLCSKRANSSRGSRCAAAADDAAIPGEENQKAVQTSAAAGAAHFRGVVYLPAHQPGQIHQTPLQLWER